MNIPFEEQRKNTRMCGAASLAMVYKSFGINRTQDEMWPSISADDGKGNKFAKTFLMCQDLLRYGLSAVIIRARNPLAIFHKALSNEIRLILVHRVNKSSTEGHCTVFTGMTNNDQIVYIHDPLNKVKQLSYRNLLKLWTRSDVRKNPEVTGNILIAISGNSIEPSSCDFCGAKIPKGINCPFCGERIKLNPAVMGCCNNSCENRTWETIVCPYCDSDIYELM